MIETIREEELHIAKTLDAAKKYRRGHLRTKGCTLFSFAKLNRQVGGLK